MVASIRQEKLNSKNSRGTQGHGPDVGEKTQLDLKEQNTCALYPLRPLYLERAKFDRGR